MIAIHNIRTDYSSTATVIKRYSQHTGGSAYYKVSGQLLALIDGGARAITVIYEGDKKWERQYREQTELVRKLLPDVQISFITEY